MQSLNQNDQLARVLGELRGRDLVVLVNQGNRGDGVIHMGGRQLLSSLGLEWTEIYEPDAPETARGDALLVFGNGAFCNATHTMVETTARLARGFDQVMILPASFDVRCAPVRSFVETWDRRYTVFCREMRSLDTLRSFRSRSWQVLLAHDLAFSADLSAWAARPHSGRAAIFRRDKEIVYDRRPRGIEGYDASHGTDREGEKLLDFVSRFSEIHTDRTHGAITAAMMGRRVYFYRNSYFKNQAIYDHSLAHLPNVRFIGKQPFSLHQFGQAMYWTRVRPIEMKLRRLFQVANRKKSPTQV